MRDGDNLGIILPSVIKKHPFLFFFCLSLSAIFCFSTIDNVIEVKTAGWIIYACTIVLAALYLILKRSVLLADISSWIIFTAGLILSGITTAAGALMGYAPLAILLSLVIFLFFGMFIVKHAGLMDAKAFCTAILMLSFLLKLLYITYTPYYLRQHDVNLIGSGKGHIGYIEYFLNNGFTLFDFDPRTVNQFYHPPLHHFLAAVWMKINLICGIEYTQAVENIQILIVFYSTVMTLAVYKIIAILKVKGKALAIPFAMFALMPGLIIRAGGINNDALCAMFDTLAIWITIRWYKKPNYRDIILLALSIGLSMMSKLSGVLVAPAVAFVFIISFVRKKELRSDIIKQFAVFAAICFPVGIWWPVYNYIKYGMPLNYVWRLSENSGQYIGNYSLYDRFFDFGLYQFTLPYVDFGTNYLEHNMFIALFKSMLFDEIKDVSGNMVLAAVLNAVLFITIAAVTAGIVLNIMMLFRKNRDSDTIIRLFLMLVTITLIISYVRFCLEYPQVCTQNFRYVIPAFVTLTVGSSVALQDIEDKKNKVSLLSGNG
jgi:hypothetical protein